MSSSVWMVIWACINWLSATGAGAHIPFERIYELFSHSLPLPICCWPSETLLVRLSYAPLYLNHYHDEYRLLSSIAEALDLLGFFLSCRSSILSGSFNRYLQYFTELCSHHLISLRDNLNLTLMWVPGWSLLLRLCLKVTVCLCVLHAHIWNLKQLLLIIFLHIWEVVHELKLVVIFLDEAVLMLLPAYIYPKTLLKHLYMQ